MLRVAVYFLEMDVILVIVFAAVVVVVCGLVLMLVLVEKSGRFGSYHEDTVLGLLAVA